MEKSLRRKFISICVISTFIVVTSLAFIINYHIYDMVENSADEAIQIIEENGGEFPRINVSQTIKNELNFTPESPYTTRYFVVDVDENNQVLSVNTSSIVRINPDTAIEYVNSILSDTNSERILDRFKYEVFEKDYGKQIIFVDISSGLMILNTVFTASVGLSGIILFLVFVVSTWTSKIAIKPIVDAYDKQKQFITDVSHELKTPLAIIKANTEVMELTSPQNQWTQSTHHQIGRLTELVNHLVSLAKIDEGDKKISKSNFSLSEAIEETVGSFFTVVESQNKKLNAHIEKNIFFTGDEQSLRMMTSTLLENALKYSVEKSEIVVSLYKKNNKIFLDVTNEAQGLKKENYDMWFERFYRGDTSRNSKNGGFGIGLSIAKAAVLFNGGTISAKSEDGRKVTVKVRL